MKLLQNDRSTLSPLLVQDTYEPDSDIFGKSRIYDLLHSLPGLLNWGVLCSDAVFQRVVY